MPLLLTQVVSSMLASNIGRAATLIGDTPNILIGSAADLSFADFDVNMTPIALISLPVVLGILYLMFRKDLTGGDRAKEVIANMGAAGSIRDGVLPRNSHYPRPRVPGLLPARALHLKAASIALFGAATLMLYFGVNVEEVLQEV
jgi:Na+/H+ antiporter NhaD/arsenite permease-like protein